MHLQFVESESTFAYFHGARAYLEAWGGRAGQGGDRQAGHFVLAFYRDFRRGCRDKTPPPPAP